MFKKYKNVAIATTTIVLLFIGLAFQNCAAPLDPSLTENTTDLQSEDNLSLIHI